MIVHDLDRKTTGRKIGDGESGTKLIATVAIGTNIENANGILTSTNQARLSGVKKKVTGKEIDIGIVMVIGDVETEDSL